MIGKVFAGARIFLHTVPTATPNTVFTTVIPTTPTQPKLCDDCATQAPKTVRCVSR